jgi:uncharacterized protein YukE
VRILKEKEKENVRHLDTKSFNLCINELNSCIIEFNDARMSVDSIINSLNDYWTGMGKTIFDADCKTVSHNLKDISELMEDIKNSLISSRDAYSQADEDLSARMAGEANSDTQKSSNRASQGGGKGASSGGNGGGGIR